MNAKMITVVAIILIALGIVVFAYQGITYKIQEDVADLGPLHLTTERPLAIQ